MGSFPFRLCTRRSSRVSYPPSFRSRCGNAAAALSRATFVALYSLAYAMTKTARRIACDQRRIPPAGRLEGSRIHGRRDSLHQHRSERRAPPATQPPARRRRSAWMSVVSAIRPRHRAHEWIACRAWRGEAVNQGGTARALLVLGSTGREGLSFLPGMPGAGMSQKGQTPS